MNTDVETILGKAVDVLDLLNRISFDDANVVQASMIQAQLFLEASRLRVQAMRARAAAEAEVSTLRASKAIAIRAKAAQSREKMTDNGVKERTEASLSIRTAEKNLAQLEEQEEFCKGLLEGLRQRKDMIEVIQRVNSSEYGVLRGAVDAAEKLEDIRNSLSSKYPGRS